MSHPFNRGSIGVNNVIMRQIETLVLSRLSLRSFSCLRRSWPFLASGILFGEALFAGFTLPVVVSHPHPSLDNPTAKLPEHRPCRHNGDLTRAVGIWEEIMCNEMILFRLRRNDLVERAILVKQKIRIPVGENPCAFGRQHEQFLATTGHGESAATIMSITLQIAHCVHLFLPGLVKFPRYVLITLII